MKFFGPSQKEKEYDNLASQHKALITELEQERRKNKEAQENWRAWHKTAEQAKAQAEANGMLAESNGRLAESNGKHAESLQKEIDQLRATLTVFSKVSEGWHNFGGATWFSLDSIVDFKTDNLHIDPKDLNSPKASFVSEISGKSITDGNLQRLKPEVLLAIFEARKKSRRGGGDGGGGGDLPNAPIPKLPQTSIRPSMT